MYAFVLLGSIHFSAAEQEQPIIELPAEIEAQLAQLDPDTRAQILSEIQQNALQEQLSQSEELLKQILRLYDAIDVVLEHTAQIVNNAASQKQLGKINYEAALQKIIETRALIDHVKKSATSTISPMNVNITINILEALLTDLLHLIETNFKDIRPLDFDHIATRSANVTLSNEEMAQSVIQLQKKLDRIKEKSHYLGLSKINMVFRKCHTFLSRHHVLSNLGTFGVMLLGAYYIMSRLDNDALTKTPILRSIPGLSKLKEIVGDHPRYNTNGALSNRDKLSILGIWDHTLGWKGIGITDLTIAPFITWKTILSPFLTNFLEMQMWVTKKWDNILNWLRGAPLDRKSNYGTKIPRARFKDIIGKDDHKAILNNLISFLDDPDFYLRAGIDINLAYLFCGPSRTGKTFLAEAFAGETYDRLTKNGKPFNFVYFSAADVQMFGFEMVFKFAQDKGPAVLFIDEIDMTDVQREKNPKMVAEMLTCLSGYHTSEQNPDRLVIVIAATNRPEALEQNLLKPGRFGKIMWFDMPSLKERLEFFHRELRKRAIMSISPEFLERLAQETEGCTFADLKSIIIIALQIAKTENNVLQERHIEEAFDRELRKIVKDDQALSWLSDEQLSIMAAHQAGQAIVNILLQDLPQISKITLYPITREICEELAIARYTNDGKVKDDKKTDPIYSYGKLFRQIGNQNRTSSVQSHNMLINECKVLLAGPIAEKMLLGHASSYHQYERAQALDIVQNIVFNGISPSKLSKTERETLLKKVHQLIIDLERQIEGMLKESKSVLTALSNALKKNKTLSSVEVLEIVKKHATDSSTLKASPASVAQAA